MKNILLCSLFLFCLSCSYKCHLPDEISNKSINIPFVRGDTDGILTEALVFQLTASGLVAYKQSNADYKLHVNVLNVENDKIGYRKDRQPDGCYRKNLMPVEGRERVSVECYLTSSLTGETVWGPRIISADVDYDYVDQDSLKDLSFIDKEGQRQTILSYSLGQLESIPCAQEAALRPLSMKLAKNIVNALIAELAVENNH
jgi:hypothetical protein